MWPGGFGWFRFVWGKVRALESRWLEGKRVPGASRGQLANQNSLIGGRFRLAPYPSVSRSVKIPPQSPRFNIALKRRRKTVEENREPLLQQKRGATGATACGGIRGMAASGILYTEPSFTPIDRELCSQYGHQRYVQYTVQSRLYHNGSQTMTSNHDTQSDSSPKLHCGSNVEGLGPSGPNVIAQLPCYSCQAPGLAWPCRTNSS